MYIKDDEINKYFNEPNWKVAHNLFQHNTISNMSVIKDGQIYQIVGSTNVNGKIDTATIQVDTGGHILEFNCDCNHCKPNELACGHIGAILLKFYGLEASDLPYSFNQKGNYADQLQALQAKKEAAHLKEQANLTFSLIEQYKNQHRLHQLQLNQHIHLIPQVKSTFNRLSLSYKIASDRSYTIKNLNTFIQNVKANEIVEYGNALVTDHNSKAFDSSSLKQIRFIKEYFHLKDDDRSIRITSDNIDDFFLTHYDNLDININFTTIDLQNFILEIQKDEDYTTIKYKEPDGITIIGHQYIYYFDHYTLNRYSKECSDALRPLLTHLENNSLTIPNNELPHFSKYIIDSVVPYVEFTGDDIDEYLPMDISLLIYVDLNNNNELSVTLDYRDDQGNTILENPKDLVLPLKLDGVIQTLQKYLEYDEITQMYYLYNEEDIYDFITRVLPSLNNDCEIYISEEIKQMNKPKNMKLNIGVRLQNDLLKIDINSINVDKEEIKDILYAFQHKKNYHRLKNGEFINLDDDSIKDLDLLFNDLNIEYNDLKDGEVEVDKYHSLYLENFMNSSSLHFNRDQHFQDLISHIEEKDPEDIQVPQNYSKILRDYQVQGFKWLKTMSEYGFGGILADDMGLGKTLQVMTLIEDGIGENHVSLVVAPATLIYNWQDEIKKFSKKLKTVCITGNIAQRKKLIESISEYDVVITSYDYIRRDYELYKDYQFYYFILDEAQYIKNQSTKNAQTVKLINGKYRFALTGTPIENSLAELWSIFDFLMPQYLFNYHYFQKQYESSIVKNNDEEKTKQLKKLVTPFILRRNKKEVLKELPDKIEQNMILPFSDEEEKIYVANLAKVNEELQQLYDIEGSDKMQILKMLTRLRQLCLEPRLVYDNIDQPSSKLKACMELIKTMQENKQKVLLFSSFTSALDLIAEECQKAGITYYMLTGSTNKEERRELVSRFQKDDTTLFLISLKAGGTGLNLTSAENVIHYDPWWNVSAQNQATDRAYRIGQKSNVQVFNLVMKDSVEEKIIEMQKRKKELADMFVENNSGGLSQMSKEDILSLFTM